MNTLPRNELPASRAGAASLRANCDLNALQGNSFMTPKEVGRFLKKIDKGGAGGCWLWTAAKRSGYGAVNFRGEAQRAHRLSWILHKGAIPNGLLVLHRCDVKHCVNPEHLFLGTDRDNNADMIAKGRKATKLTREDVMFIRNSPQRWTAAGRMALRERFGLSVNYIAALLRREWWKTI